MDTITAELGYKDNLVVEGEQFHLWVIEAPETVKEEFPSESLQFEYGFSQTTWSHTELEK